MSDAPTPQPTPAPPSESALAALNREQAATIRAQDQEIDRLKREAANKRQRYSAMEARQSEIQAMEQELEQFRALGSLDEVKTQLSETQDASRELATLRLRDQAREAKLVPGAVEDLKAGLPAGHALTFEPVKQDDGTEPVMGFVQSGEGDEAKKTALLDWVKANKPHFEAALTPAPATPPVPPSPRATSAERDESSDANYSRKPS